MPCRVSINPMRTAPHQDIGGTVCAITGGFQSVGETVCSYLDVPFDATVRISGPHRLIDGYMDLIADASRDLLRKVTKF